jgi:large subunit ribosomal protein L4
MKVPYYSTTGEKAKTLELNQELFGEVNKVVLSQAVRVYMSNLRQGTSKVKTRSEINRTKKKWFRQKGTGNARHGARTPNIFVGGGVSHGPNGEQNWLRSLPPAMKHHALRSAVTAQAEANQLSIHDGFNSLTGKTKAAAQIINEVVKGATHTLVVIAAYDEKTIQSLQNLSQVAVMTASRINAYHVAAANHVIFTKDAWKLLEDRLTKLSTETEATPVVAETKTEVVKTEAKPKAAKTVVAKAPKVAKPKVTKKVATK